MSAKSILVQVAIGVTVWLLASYIERNYLT